MDFICLNIGFVGICQGISLSFVKVQDCHLSKYSVGCHGLGMVVICQGIGLSSVRLSNSHLLNYRVFMYQA